MASKYKSTKFVAVNQDTEEEFEDDEFEDVEDETKEEEAEEEEEEEEAEEEEEEEFEEEEDEEALPVPPPPPPKKTKKAAEPVKVISSVTAAALQRVSLPPVIHPPKKPVAKPKPQAEDRTDVKSIDFEKLKRMCGFTSEVCEQLIEAYWHDNDNNPVPPKGKPVSAYLMFQQDYHATLVDLEEEKKQPIPKDWKAQCGIEWKTILTEEQRCKYLLKEELLSRLLEIAATRATEAGLVLPEKKKPGPKKQKKEVEEPPVPVVAAPPKKTRAKKAPAAAAKRKTTK